MNEIRIEKNLDRLPYEISFVHVSHAERSPSAHNQGGSVACLATLSQNPRRRPMALRPTLSDGLPFSGYDRF